LDKRTSDVDNATAHLTEEIERLDSKIDDVEEEHINVMGATEEVLATHTKQINKLFAKYREIYNVYEQNKDLYNEPTPPEPKAEPTIEQSIAQWRPGTSDARESKHVIGAPLATLSKFASTIHDTMQDINVRPNLFTFGKESEWLLKEGEMFKEFAQQKVAFVKADKTQLTAIVRFLHAKFGTFVDKHTQYSTPASQYHMAIVPSWALGTFSKSYLGVQLPAESATKIKRYYDDGGMRGADHYASWYVLVVEVYGGDQVYIRHLPCRTRQVARKVYSIFDAFMTKAAALHNDLKNEESRPGIAIKTLPPYTEFAPITLFDKPETWLNDVFV
jgi:hypothetical protein